MTHYPDWGQTRVMRDEEPDGRPATHALVACFCGEVFWAFAVSSDLMLWSGPIPIDEEAAA